MVKMLLSQNSTLFHFSSIALIKVIPEFCLNILSPDNVLIIQGRQNTRSDDCWFI